MNLVFFPHYQWSLALAVMVSLWCWGWVRPNYGMPTACLFAFLSLSSIWCWVWVENRYYPVHFYEQLNLRYFSADSVARMMLVCVPMMYLGLKRNFFEVGKKAAFLFTVASAVSAILLYGVTDCFEQMGCSAFGNPSIMFGAAVCTLPLLKRNWAVVALVFVAVLLSKSSISLGLFGMYLAYELLAARKFKLIAVSILPVVIGFFTLGKVELLSSGERFQIWPYMMKFWMAPWNIPMGTGFGTYHVMSLPLQKEGGMQTWYHWSTLHNDWLQMVFEGGVLGGALMIAVYLKALLEMLSLEMYSVAASIVLFGVYMSVNPALHHAIPALFGAWLFTYALRRNQLIEEMI